MVRLMKFYANEIFAYRKAIHPLSKKQKAFGDVIRPNAQYGMYSAQIGQEKEGKRHEVGLR